LTDKAWYRLAEPGQACCALLFALTCVPASPVCAGDTQIQISASELFTLAARFGATDKARAIAIYQALERDPHVAIRNEARFRHARLLETGRELVEAAVLLRAILDEQPEAQPVRLELAALLARMGDISGARRELRQAQAGALPPQVAQVVKQYAAALRSRKPWGGSLELALAPDSNINRATSQTTLDTVIAPLNLSHDARQQSGLGLKEASQIYARIDTGQAFTLVPRLSSQATLYGESQFNDISASAQMGVEWRHGADRFTPSAGLTWRWYGRQIYGRTQSVSLDWLHPAGPRAQIDTQISINRARYPHSSFQDGMIYTASLSYERAFTTRTGAACPCPAIARQRLTRAMRRGRLRQVGSIGTIWAS
jgi:hypothetical protein